MNGEDKRDDVSPIVSENKQALATRSPSLISRGLRDLTGSLDSILVELGKTLLVDRVFEEVICAMIEKANEVFRSQTYSLFLMDSEKGELVLSPFVALRGDFEPTRIKIGEGLAEVGLAPTRRTRGGLAGWVAQTGQVVVVPDTSADSRFVAEVDGRGTTEARSIVAAPIRFEDRCLGVIELINCVGPEGFSKRSLVLLEAVADFAAIAIENRRYVSEIEDLVSMDDPTGLHKSSYLHYALDLAILRGEFSLISIDLNTEFRDVPVGAWLSCLAQVGMALKGSCRSLDSACRYGDTKFALLLRQASKEAACKIARDLGRRFHSADWLHYGGRTVKLPACIGVVSCPEDATTKDELLQAGEETMSLVRGKGRGGIAAANEGILQVEDAV